jgi:DNA-binding IclR family transcriptional regulator
VFLLVRGGFDAVCLDRWEGPFPIRTFTGDIGGRVPLGLGQGALVILAHLPEAEREEVMRFNVPRIQHMGALDEVFLRTEAARARTQGYANTNSGIIEGMAGCAVPVFDRNERVVRIGSRSLSSCCSARRARSRRRSIRSTAPCAARPRACAFPRPADSSALERVRGREPQPDARGDDERAVEHADQQEHLGL